MDCVQKWFIILCCVTVFQVRAVDKVVYGEDNRLDIIDSPSLQYVMLAYSTAARINKSNLRIEGNLAYFGEETLADIGYCADDRFVHQKTSADCSGFLVGEDLVVTAGHCMQDVNDCEGNYWVFDYKNDYTGDIAFVSTGSVYSCAEIIEQKLDPITDEDYALIRLDRKVEDRSPLKYRREGKINDNDPLVIIGHPMGLPTKISDSANVRTNDNEFFFVANLDSFGGNSGSAVFNAQSGLVEGVLVRGENDYNYDPEHGCYRVNVCPNDGCRGEEVTRITRIKALQI